MKHYYHWYLIIPYFSNYISLFLGLTHSARLGYLSYITQKKAAMRIWQDLFVDLRMCEENEVLQSDVTFFSLTNIISGCYMCAYEILIFPCNHTIVYWSSTVTVFAGGSLFPVCFIWFCLKFIEILKLNTARK